MGNIDEVLDDKYPLIADTNAGRLFSTVRRMKAEKELEIPITHRTGFAISAKLGKPANELGEADWEEFYSGLCGQLKHDYSEMHERLFP